MRFCASGQIRTELDPRSVPLNPIDGLSRVVEPFRSDVIRSVVGAIGRDGGDDVISCNPGFVRATF
jgi:hypothetical protein